MSTTSSTAIGWFILHFKDTQQSLVKDILFLSDPKQTIHDAACELEKTVFERFGRINATEAQGGFLLSALSVMGADIADIEITFSQLVSYIRTLPASPQPCKPDLFGFGSNSVWVKFQYVGRKY